VVERVESVENQRVVEIETWEYIRRHRDEIMIRVERMLMWRG
jgi:hypothetical protein